MRVIMGTRTLKHSTVNREWDCNVEKKSSMIKLKEWDSACQGIKNFSCDVKVNTADFSPM